MQLNLGENIKKYRKEMNLTQEGLADAFGVTVGAVSKWESGNTIPDILTLVELADFFSISMDVLLGCSISSKSISDIESKLRTLLKENKHDEAISEAEKALVRYPGNFRILLQCAKTYHIISVANAYEKYRHKTIELYEAALKYISQNEDPDESEFSIRLNIAELMSKDDPEAALEELGRINYMGIADAYKATILMDMGRMDEAMEAYTKVLVSILVRTIQLSNGLVVGLIKSGKKKDFKETMERLAADIDADKTSEVGT